MKVVLQRVSSASVTVGGEVVGSVGRGYCLLVGFTHGDTEAEVDWMATKIAGLRLFPDDDGKLNRDLADTGGGVLVVSQFTLYGDASKGRRPSFGEASKPEHAIPLYERFCARLAEAGPPVATGVFGASMRVDIVNDGPVTLVLECEATST